MAKIISYNLADVSKEQAKANGKVFYDAWQDYQRRQLVKRLAASKAVTA